jgi:aspartyl protease family protein
MDTDKNHNSGKSIGKGMLVAGFALALVGMTYFFNGVLDRQNNPNSRPDSSVDDAGTREVVLQRNRQGHYVSNGMINGEPVQFLLDTGATDVAIPMDVARRVQLELGYQGRAQTANGLTTVYDTHINELRLGNIVLNDIDASIVPNMNGETILLGMSALQQIEFTQRGTAMTLRQFTN